LSHDNSAIETQLQKNSKKTPPGLSTTTLAELSFFFKCLRTFQRSKLNFKKNPKKKPPGLPTTTLAELSFFFKCLRTFQRSKLNFKKNPKKKPPGLPTTTLAELSFFFKCLRTFQRLLSTNKKPKKKDQLNVSHYFKQSGVGGASLLFESVFTSSNKTRQLRVGGASL
jgi:hypothetical protein